MKANIALYYFFTNIKQKTSNYDVFIAFYFKNQNIVSLLQAEFLVCLLLVV